MLQGFQLPAGAAGAQAVASCYIWRSLARQPRGQWSAGNQQDISGEGAAAAEQRCSRHLLSMACSCSAYHTRNRSGHSFAAFLTVAFAADAQSMRWKCPVLRIYTTQQCAPDGPLLVGRTAEV